MKPLNALIVVVAVFAFCSLQINRAKADDMESIWKSDGSLVNIYGFFRKYELALKEHEERK